MSSARLSNNYLTMKKYIILLITSVVLFAAVYAFGYYSNHGGNRTGANLPVTGYTTAAVSSGVLISTTSSTQVLATSTARNYAEIDTTGGPVYCNMNGGKPATLYSGIYIASSTKYVISPDTDNLYRGTVNCIGASGITSTTTVTQY